MTEAEWFTCCKVTVPLMNWLHRHGSDRKFHLAGCAAVRHVWEAVDQDDARALVELVERYADGRLDAAELARATRSVGIIAYERVSDHSARRLEQRLQQGRHGPPDVKRWTRRCAGVTAASHLGMPEGWQAGYSAMVEAARVGKRADQWNWQCLMLRDLFGNPFKPVAVEQAWLDWRDRTVVKLAQAAYEERELPAGYLERSRLAILADALDEAGCSNRLLLSHLRADGFHVRGCWAVDLLLGKH